MWWSKFKLNFATECPVAKLSFDKDNPRYSAEKGLPHSTDTEIISYLDQTSDLAELIQSISTSGYVDIEPLIVLGQKDKLIVLEGNRRLAALKLLTDPKIAEQCGILLPARTAGIDKTLKKVKVYRVANRDEARDFIGFKHINGPHRWDSIAKAKFAADWLRSERKKGKRGLTLADIARRMGDRHSTLQRMVLGLFALEQAERVRVFSRADRFKGRQFAFSHLYVALTRNGYRQFLGIEQVNDKVDPDENPIPKSNIKQLGQVLNWLYGSQLDEERPIIESQNPGIKQLGEVLENPKARKLILEMRNLEAAYTEVNPPQKQFERHIVDLQVASGQAVQKMRAYDGRDETLYTLANEAFENSSILIEHMKRVRGRKTS